MHLVGHLHIAIWCTVHTMSKCVISRVRSISAHVRFFTMCVMGTRGAIRPNYRVTFCRKPGEIVLIEGKQVVWRWTAQVVIATDTDKITQVLNRILQKRRYSSAWKPTALITGNADLFGFSEFCFHTFSIFRTDKKQAQPMKLVTFIREVSLLNSNRDFERVS